MSKSKLPEASLEEKYKSIYSLRKRFEADIMVIVKDIIDAAGYEITFLTSRTKEVLKFIGKANKITERGKRKYSKPLIQITDMSGIRVIVQYKDHANEIEELLYNTLNVYKELSRNTIKVSGSDRFGYPSIQIIASLTENLCEAYNCQHIKNLKFEVQIRTILEHAWCELSRQLFYDKDVKNDTHRALNACAANIEHTDHEFIRLRKEVENTPITAQNNPEVNLQILSAAEVINLLQSSQAIKNVVSKLAHIGLSVGDNIRNEFTPQLAEILNKYQNKFGHEIESALSQNEATITYACELYMKATNMTNFARDTLLIAALAIIENGGTTPEEYSENWKDRWKNGFRQAAHQYNTTKAVK